MNILITGAGGFVGKNLTENLLNIKDGRDRTRPLLKIDNVFCFDRENTDSQLDEYCRRADFVFNLAGVNRPENAQEFISGNAGFLERLLAGLKKYNNKAPVMLSSSIQASLEGRFKDSEYGKSKLAAEKILFAYGRENGVKTLVYRFPNLFGKWCRPNYNSVTATFCYNIARGLPITVSDENARLTLLYIDDLVDEMLDALEGNEHRCTLDGSEAAGGEYCFCPITHEVTLGEMAGLLNKFSAQPQTLMMPEIPSGSFAKKLYSTYLSYLPKEKAAFGLKMNCDDRGSFTELLKTAACGQFSVNVSKPGITKGQHWHNSKWELFIVVSGHALIRQRRIGDDEIMEFEVSGDEIKAVHMLPGYTHSIINLSDTQELVTLMWANEPFDPGHPDTFFEKV